jgi:glucose-fructose oxidoreductase
VTASGQDPRFIEVEEMTSAILRFPDERVATFTCSFGASDVSEYRIVGTKGSLRVDPAYEFAGELRQFVTIGGRTRERVFPKRDQFAPELVYFSDCILNDTQPEPSGREGLADVQVIRALVRSAESGGEPMEIGESIRVQRPSLRQEMRRAPVKKPELVHARSPSKD